jgi:hypothetical protein
MTSFIESLSIRFVVCVSGGRFASPFAYIVFPVLQSNRPKTIKVGVGIQYQPCLDWAWDYGRN